MSKIRDNIQRILNIGGAVASFGSVVNPAFAAIPIFTSVFNEVCNYWNLKDARVSRN